MNIGGTGHQGGRKPQTNQGLDVEGEEEMNVGAVTVEPRLEFKLSLVRFLLIFAVTWAISDVITNNTLEHSPLNYYLTVTWSVFLPIAIVGLLGAIRSRRISSSKFQGTVGNKIIFTVPTVCRNDTIPALKRVVDSILEHAPRNLTNFRVDIVVDEGAEAMAQLHGMYSEISRVRIVVVPYSYETPNGTVYKARANHYALELRGREGENTKDIFVYHLDDDTAVNPSTVSSLAQFVMGDSGRFHLAQGVLTFPHQLSPSWFCRLADSVRPPYDLTMFYFWTGVIGSPLAGLHGEHLLIRASAEAEIGWDFGRVRVEDAFFALRFAERYPGKSAFLNSCTYGASPGSIRDLIKQRRGWIRGLIELVFNKTIRLKTKAVLAYHVVVWASGIFQHVGIILIVAYVTGMANTSPVLREIIPIWSLNLAYQFWVYLEGLRINLTVSSIGNNGLVCSLLTIPFVFVATAVESLAGGLGLVDFLRRKTGFEVIRKER